MKQSIYLSAFLNQEAYGKSVYAALHEKLSLAGYEVKDINNHKQNIWCRDYMPIVTYTNKLVQFKYAPSYMMDSEKWKNRIPKHKPIQKEFKLEFKNARKIILDGGAIEIHEKQGIISDRVFRDNKIEQDTLIEAIQDHLDLDRLIVVPQYPYDFTGHVDGMVRFIDNKTVLINDLSKEMNHVAKDERKKKNLYRCKLIKNWYYSFLMAFHNANLKIEVLPSNYVRNKNDKDGNGIYLNFLKLPGHIVMPAYKNKKYDNLAKEKLDNIYDREVITIDARALAEEGGMINCVTWSDLYI